MPGPAASGGEAAKTKHVVILVLGILGIVCCNILGPIAWIMGKKELAAIRGGQSASDEGMTKVGMILGIVGTVLLGLGILWMIFGGFAVIMGIMNGGARGL